MFGYHSNNFDKLFSSVIVAMPLHRRSNVISCEKHFLMNILCNNSEKFHTSISTDVRAADDIVSGYYLLNQPNFVGNVLGWFFQSQNEKLETQRR